MHTSGGTALAQPATPSADEVQRFQQFVEDVSETMYGQIRIAGKVLDDAGNPLNGVQLTTVYTDKAMSIRAGEPDGPAPEVRQIDPSFSVDVTNARTLSLVLEKVDGPYEVLHLDFLYDRPRSDVRIEQGIQHYDITVTLHRATATSPSLEYDDIGLWIRNDGVLVLWDVTETVAKRGPEARLLRVNSLSDTTDSVVYARRDEGGGYQLVVANGKEGDGFVQVAIDNSDRDRDPIGTLRTAPASGYGPVLSFGDDVAEVSGAVLYFYCKLSGLFGKGVIKRIYRDSVTGVSPRIDVYLQPDGSQNVDW